MTQLAGVTAGVALSIHWDAEFWSFDGAANDGAEPRHESASRCGTQRICDPAGSGRRTKGQAVIADARSAIFGLRCGGAQ
ncbi:hypothetical protein V1282_000188 [Nitrobacteraceae bacterium AZCC 2146]